MKLEGLIDKKVCIEFLSEETSDVVGELYDIDEEMNIIHVHVHFNSKDLFIPLSAIKTISEQY